MFYLFYVFLFSFCSMAQSHDILDEDLQREYFKYQLKMLEESKQNTPADKYIETVIKFVDVENPKTQYDGELNPGEFAITLDDGPDPRMTAKVLDVLKEYGVKANYFLVGVNARSNLELVKREVKEGHSICNHSYQHRNIKSLSLSQGMEKAKEEITKGVQEVFHASGGVSYPFFRFPFGAFTNKLLAELYEMDMVDFFWSGFSFSPEIFKPIKVTVNGESKMVKNHGIILKHDTGEHPGFDREMRTFLGNMKKNDYKAVLFVPSYLKDVK